MEKQFSIVVAGSGEVKDIGISPGATVLEVMNEAGLQGYQLSRKGGELLSPDTDLFEVVKDSEKLYATPQDVSVGEGGFASHSSKVQSISAIVNNFIRNKITNNLDYEEKWEDVNRKKVRIVGTKPVISLGTISRVRLLSKKEYIRKKIAVMRTDRENPYWYANGWTQTEGLYRGYYRTDFGQWHGQIHENYEGNYSFYIFRPPRALKKSDHWQCFSKKGKDKYSIHFDKKPKDVSSGILTVEQLISESFIEDGKRGWNVF